MEMNLFKRTEEEINGKRKIGLFVSRNQTMEQVNQVIDYLSQFARVAICSVDNVPVDLSCLVLPDLSNIIDKGMVDAEFINFFNRYITNKDKEVNSFVNCPIVGINNSCLSLWNHFNMNIEYVTGHYKMGEGGKTLHLLTLTNVPRINRLFPLINKLNEEKIKTFSTTLHIKCMNVKDKHPNIHVIAHHIVGDHYSPEAFVHIDYVDKQDIINFVGLQSVPWLKMNYTNSFDFKVGGLAIGDHLSNLIFHKLTEN